MAKLKKQKRQSVIIFGCIGILLALAVFLLLPGNQIKQDAAETESDCVTEAFSESPDKQDTTQPIQETEAVKAEAEIAQDSEKEAMTADSEYHRIQNLNAGDLAVNGIVSADLTERLFYASEIDGALLDRITGCSYTPNDNILPSELSYLKMLYCGADGNTYVGEMIVNKAIETKVLEIFRTLYEHQYPIERMVLIDHYNAKDEASMEANNTSAFNYRTVSGSNKLSNHSYGTAIDLNPKYNPYVKTASDGTVICQPKSGRPYMDRNGDFDYKIDENDLAYQLFTEAGFTWGGSWNSVKDYQHFEIELF